MKQYQAEKASLRAGEWDRRAPTPYSSDRVGDAKAGPRTGPRKWPKLRAQRHLPDGPPATRDVAVWK